MIWGTESLFKHLAGNLLKEDRILITRQLGYKKGFEIYSMSIPLILYTALNLSQGSSVDDPSREIFSLSLVSRNVFNQTLDRGLDSSEVSMKYVNRFYRESKEYTVAEGFSFTALDKRRILRFRKPRETLVVSFSEKNDLLLLFDYGVNGKLDGYCMFSEETAEEPCSNKINQKMQDHYTQSLLVANEVFSAPSLLEDYLMEIKNQKD